MEHAITLTIDGREYIAIPADRYRAERAGATEDGVAWARAELGKTLRSARETAGLTQSGLAKRLKRSQSMVARAESGDLRISERYVKAVLKACRLPADWTPPAEG